MSQIDEYMKSRKSVDKQFDSESAASAYMSVSGFLDKLYSDYADFDVSVEDRSDIINPIELLSPIFSYASSSSYAQSLYDEALAFLQNIQKQQEASYEEFYNSTEQQVIRDKVAGLNPDILGVQGTSSASPDSSQSSPMDSFRSAEALRVQEDSIRVQKLSSVISMISTIGQVAQLPMQFANMALTKSQTAGSMLANVQSFEDMVSNEIANRLSDSISASIDAGKSLDIASWFSDDNNFSGLDSYFPDSSPVYKSSLANVRKRMQSSLAKAYDQGAVTAENRKSFASMIADPRNSSDVLIQAAQLRPYMEAANELKLAQDKYQKELAEWQSEYQKGLSVDQAIAAANAENEYTAEYYQEMDGKKQAIYERYIAEANAIASRMKSAIDKNLLDIYSANPNNMKGFAAAYVYSGGASSSWIQWLYSHEIMLGSGDQFNPCDLSTGIPNTGSKFHDWSLNPTGVPPIPNSARSFIPPGAAIVR